MIPGKTAVFNPWVRTLSRRALTHYFLSFHFLSDPRADKKIWVTKNEQPEVLSYSPSLRSEERMFCMLCRARVSMPGA